MEWVECVGGVGGMCRWNVCEKNGGHSGESYSSFKVKNQVSNEGHPLEKFKRFHLHNH